MGGREGSRILVGLVTGKPSLERRAGCVYEALKSHCQGRVFAGLAIDPHYARDFGGMLERHPQVVLQPSNERDVVFALRAAAEHELPISTRGAGHGQSGQSLGTGLVLDLTKLNRISNLDRSSERVEVEGGATWYDLVDRTFAWRMLPIGLTHALDTTIAGTLSIAGIGGESHRVGAQVDNVVYLDVATPAGEVYRCSPTENPRLFDAVRAGVGQCGVILRVGYPLRSCRSMISSRCFGYVDPESFIRDCEALSSEGAIGRWLYGGLVRDPLRGGRWLLVLFVGAEHEPADRPRPLPALHAELELRGHTALVWAPNGTRRHPYFRVFGRDMSALHPWIEYLVSKQCAVAALETFLSTATEFLGDGQAGMICLRRPTARAPLFATPASDFILGIGAFARYALGEREVASAAMAAFERRMAPFEGKRYLSGYLGETWSSRWREHYGDAWAAFADAKNEFDPGHRLNPGFIDW